MHSYHESNLWSINSSLLSNPIRSPSLPLPPPLPPTFSPYFTWISNGFSSKKFKKPEFQKKLEKSQICMKDKFLTSVLFKFLHNSNLKGSRINTKSWWFFNTEKWISINCLILHVSCNVEEKNLFHSIFTKKQSFKF